MMATPSPTIMPRSTRFSLALALLVTLAACRDRNPEEKVPVTVSRRDTVTRPLGDGDVRIVDEGDAIELALVGDSISSGLSPHALEKARRETDTGTVNGTGFGASIERMVKGKVQDALSIRVSTPLSSVKDVRYENGALKFDWNGKAPSYGSMQTNGRPLLESFRPDDARRFAEAVRARKRSAGSY